jgi:hypothetical protein
MPRTERVGSRVGSTGFVKPMTPSDGEPTTVTEQCIRGLYSIQMDSVFTESSKQ